MKRINIALHSSLTVASLFFIAVLNAQHMGFSVDAMRAATGKFGLQFESPVSPKWSAVGGVEVWRFSQKQAASESFFPVFSSSETWKIVGQNSQLGLKRYLGHASKPLTGFNLDARLNVAVFNAGEQYTSSFLFTFSAETSNPSTRFVRIGGDFRLGYQMAAGSFRFNPTVGFSLSKSRQTTDETLRSTAVPAESLPSNLHGLTTTIGWNVGFVF